MTQHYHNGWPCVGRFIGLLDGSDIYDNFVFYTTEELEELWFNDITWEGNTIKSWWVRY